MLASLLNNTEEGTQLFREDRVKKILLVAGAFGLLAALGCSGEDDNNGGPITIMMTDDNGNVIANAEIITQNADGTFNELITTDTNGEVTYNLPDSGMVTFPDTDGGGDPDNFTYGGLGGGNHIHWGGTAAPTPVTFDVTLPGDFGGASLYFVEAGCSSSLVFATGTPVELDLADCGSSADVIALAYDMSQALVAYSFATGLDPTTGATTLGAWQTDIQTFTLTVNNIPNTVDGVDTVMSLRRGNWTFAPSGGALDVNAGTIDLMYPPGFGDGIEFGAEAYWADESYAGIFRGEGSVSGTGTIDFANALPVPESVSVDDTDAARPALNWTGSTDGADAIGLFTAWDDGGSNAGFWQLIMPGGTASGQMFPELGTDYASNAPVAGNFLGQVLMLDYDHISGLDEFLDLEGADNPTLPSNYTVRSAGSAIGTN
jgi:hypothetical protein